MRKTIERTGQSLPNNRPEPFRLISISCLTQTTNESNDPNYGPIVHYSGRHQYNSEDAWSPIRRFPETIEVSHDSWLGLHTRMLASLPIAEVA
ncbi:MAG TPA: hypothetical protein QF703_03605 [Candidatus Thalassarchaeaceae archaeon]|nr:hypothetical protein [Candidatus Thalassarchaeaceae archaeon]